MKKLALLIFIFAISAFAQEKIAVSTMLEIVRAEDERRFDVTLERLLKHPQPAVRKRAALAAGRIGSERAVPILSKLAESDPNESVRVMSIFALGEIESASGTDTVLKILNDSSQPESLRAVAIEAAGKIAAAQLKSNFSKAEKLGEAILDALEAEANKKKQNLQLILFGLTAAFRSQAQDADSVISLFLTHLNPQVRADAANALARLRSKNFNESLRSMLLTDPDPIARANAARALGFAEDKQAAQILAETAVSDDDLRVRVSAIRALANLKDQQAAEALISRASELLKNFKNSSFRNPIEKNELLEISTALGACFAESNNEKVLNVLKQFRESNKRLEPEIETAYARIAPSAYLEAAKSSLQSANDWQSISAIAQGLTAFATLQNDKLKEEAVLILRSMLNTTATKAQPAVLSAFAAFKTKDAEEILRKNLESEDVFVRTTAAELLGNFPANEENAKALVQAFAKSMITDIDYDDAQIAILSSLAKIDKSRLLAISQRAYSSPNYLVRRHAFNLLNGTNSNFDQSAFDAFVGTVKPYKPANKTKLGQVTNVQSDYLRAISRRNGQVKVIVETEKGNFTIELRPEEAPLTVDNFIKLARQGFFDGLEVHRVVPNFVIQDGDPRGDSNGGPGWQIRCEINMLSYTRGAVGMALSGKDTGGSQWFITHSPQPHLNGGYTVFGYVNEDGMKVVDSIVRGDKILKIRIIENETKSVKQPKRK